MSEMRRIGWAALWVLAVGMCTLSSRAQSTVPSDGWVNLPGYSIKRGEVKRTLEIVISERDDLHTEVARFEDAQRSRLRNLVRYDVRTYNILNGYAYMRSTAAGGRADDPAIGGRRPVDLGVLDLELQWAFDDALALAQRDPAVAAFIGLDGDLQQLGGLIEDEGVREDLVRIQEQIDRVRREESVIGRVDQLIAMLREPDGMRPEGGQERQMRRRALLAVYLSMSPADVLYDILGFLPFPFILSNRTVGGAEGTEVVTYARQSGIGTVDVYYFYIASASNYDVKLAAYNHKNMRTPITTIEVGEYAHIPMAWTEIGGGEHDWCLPDGRSIVVDEISDITDTVLTSVLRYAHRDACDAWATDPTTATFGSIELDCALHEPN